MTGDLFSRATAPTGPHTGRGHPETSRAAAEKVQPSLATIREEVLRYAREVGDYGFLDDDLARVFGSDSYRKRRTELADEGFLVDSGQRRANREGNACVVWVLRTAEGDLVRSRERRQEKAQARELKDEARAMARELEGYARTMKADGRLFYSRIEEAARILKALSL